MWNIFPLGMHDKTIRQVLFFKHISWRVLKIEASSNVKGNDYYGGNGPPQQRSSLNSPLRFLTENGRCRITIKKSSLGGGIFNFSGAVTKYSMMLDTIYR
jgi:hypothetical protein